MNKILSFLIILLLNLLGSCKDDEQIKYPVKPHIEFKNIKIVTGFFDLLGNSGDSLELSLNYTDGDSNIGSPPIPDTIIYNCQTTFYIKKNGVFNLADSDGYFSNPKYSSIPEILEFNRIYRMRELTVTARSLYEGELHISIFLFGYHSPFNLGDTLKASVQITDNNGNKSNIAEMGKVYSY
jgi:hypothetical protein